MNIKEIKPDMIISGAILPEPVKVITTQTMGDALKIIGEGMNSGKVHQPILTQVQIAQLTLSAKQKPFDGDAAARL